MLAGGNENFQEFAELFDVDQADLDQVDSKQNIKIQDRYLRPSSSFYKKGLLALMSKLIIVLLIFVSLTILKLTGNGLIYLVLSLSRLGH